MLNKTQNVSKKDLEFIDNVLRKAGKLVLEKFGNIQKYEQKNEHAQIVTEVDIASERLIVSEIERHYPTNSIIAEESGFKEKNSEYIWIIDPIDGTSNYANGIPWFGIMIARCKNWIPDIAGIYLPITGEIYLASKGSGSFKNGNKIAKPRVIDLSQSLINYSLDANNDIKKTELEARIIKNLIPKIRNIRSTNSILDEAYTIDGRFGACINQGTKIWDIASAILIAKEAGYKVSDIDGNNISLKVDKSTYNKNFTIIIANPGLFDQILNIIRMSKA